MESSYGPVTVQLFGGAHVEGEVLTRCKINIFGESPQATVKLFQFQSFVRRFVEVDRLTMATLKEAGETGFDVDGISDALATEVGLAGDDARVSWHVELHGCPTC